MANNIPPNEMLNANASIYQPQAAQPKLGGPQAHPGQNQQANLQSLPPHIAAIRPQSAPFQTYITNQNRVAGMQPPPHRPHYGTHPGQPFAANLMHQQQAAAVAAAAASHRGSNSIHPNSQVTSAGSHRGNSSMHHNSQVTAAQQAQQAAAAAAAHQQQQVHQHQHQQAHLHQAMANQQHQAMGNHQQVHHQHQHANVAAAGIPHRQNAAGGPGGGPPQMAAIPPNRMPQMPYYMQYQHNPQHPMQIYLPPQHMMTHAAFAQINPYTLEAYQQQMQAQAQAARGYQQSQQPLAPMSNNIPSSEMMNPNAGVYQPQQSQQPPPPQIQQQQPLQQMQEQGQQQSSQPPPNQIKYPELKPLSHNKPRQMATVCDEDGNPIDLLKFETAKNKKQAAASNVTSTTVSNNSNQHSRSSSVSGENNKEEKTAKGVPQTDNNNEEITTTEKGSASSSTTTNKSTTSTPPTPARSSSSRSRETTPLPSTEDSGDVKKTSTSTTVSNNSNQHSRSSSVSGENNKGEKTAKNVPQTDNNEEITTTEKESASSITSTNKSATSTPPTSARSSRSRETTPLPPTEDDSDVKKTATSTTVSNNSNQHSRSSSVSGENNKEEKTAKSVPQTDNNNEEIATTEISSASSSTITNKSATSTPLTLARSSSSRETTPLPPTEDSGDVKKTATSTILSNNSNQLSRSSGVSGENNKEEKTAKSVPQTDNNNEEIATTEMSSASSSTTTNKSATSTPLTLARSSSSRETTPLPPTEDSGDVKKIAESASASATASPSIAANGDSNNIQSAAEEEAISEASTTATAATTSTTTSATTPTGGSGSVSAASLSRNSSQNGPKVYERDELLKLREHASDHAITLSNQENLKDIVKKIGNSKNPSQADMFLPNFANSGGGGGGGRSMNDSYRNKSQNQASRRPSQPSKNYQDPKSRKITSTSQHYGEQLYKPAANAWRPGQTKADDPVEAETEVLLKSVRAILNKLTPQNYHTLLEQFKALKIDSRNRLARVISLIFDKAVKEPSFVVQYAGFCSELVHIKVVETNERGETVDVKFKNLLIEKCQETFFREMYSDIENFEERQREIEECEDEKKKKELEDIMDDDKRLSRRRSIGNIKLIAELYKLNMLNARIMFSCIQTLLKHQHEEYVEVLCALITNIGANLASAIKNKPVDQETFEDIFAKLTAIQKQEEGALKVSSRIRFTILDLLDLRKNNWVNRRKAEGPKTIAQVHEDMDQAERRKNMEAAEYNKKKRMAPNPDEWQQVNRSRGKSGPSISQSKLNVTSFNAIKDSLFNNIKPTLSSGSPFGAFAQGSHGGSSNSQSRNSSLNFDKGGGSNSTNSVQDGDKTEKQSLTPAQKHAQRLYELCMVGESDIADAKADELEAVSDELVSKTYGALVYKCAAYFMSDKGQKDPKLEDKITGICSFCTTKERYLTLMDLLNICADVYRDLEFPQNRLYELLEILFTNDVITKPNIIKCYQNGTKFKNVVKHTFEKFASMHKIQLQPPEQQQPQPQQKQQ